MNPDLIANILSLSLFFVALFISLRAFYVYSRSRSGRLFVLALSMGVIALTAAAGFAGDNVTSVSLNVDWFNYIGQTVSFLFILLSFLRSEEGYLRRLIRWQVIVSLLLLILLLLAPVLPPEFPAPAVTKTVLSGSRGVICMIIFFYYYRAFVKKEARFSMLMSGAFLALSFGYLVILPKYIYSGMDQIDQMGDIFRVIGLIVLLVAVSLG
ncbi:MAG TPA: hypothetical protein VFQ30_19175 [Ktedonobacteraceae bacterium]|nr:hypothetical protein [Ktedonobacteraceae bacterium]